MSCAEHDHLWACYWTEKVDALTAEAHRRRRTHDLEWHLQAESARAIAVPARDLALACERFGV